MPLLLGRLLLRRSRRRTVALIAALLLGPLVALPGASAQVPRDTSRALTIPLTGRPRPCKQGWIEGFPCRNMTLLAFLPPSAIGGNFEGGYDIWGWTDSLTKREFVLLGGVTGTAFVEVTDPVHPVYLGRLPFHPVPGKASVDPRTLTTAAEMSTRFYSNQAALGIPGIKVYKHYAFITVETLNGGLQVFDLTQLRAVQRPPVVFQETAHYDGFGNAHTLTLNEATGFAYANGSSTCGGGLHMVDVRTPTKPVFAGCFPETLEQPQLHSGYIHDAQCVVYHGPDRDYQGREVCVNYAGAGLGIIDVTEKTAPKRISVTTYPNPAFTHQGWFTDDQRYIFVDDEHDDGAGGVKQTRTIVIDLTDLDDPVVLTEFYGTTDATDHNLYLRGRYMYQSNYAAGLRIVDIQDPKHPKEVGYLDTAPGMSGPGMMLGSWGNYPYLKNNVVAVASTGLFLVRLGH